MANQGGDTPIVVADGSLTLESAVPWAEFHGSGNRRSHPHTGKFMTQVVVIIAGNSQTVALSGKSCTVAVKYASTDITISTGDNGKGLVVATDFGSFQPGATPNQLTHKQGNAKISRVTVTSDHQAAFDSAASGGTRLVISYQGAEASPGSAAND